MRLTCSVSFWSISAMIALMVPITSSDTTAVSRNACSASVRTAVSTSDRARSVLGLNSFCRSAPNWSASSVAAAAPPSVLASAICFLPSLTRSLLRFCLVGERFQQRGIVQDLRDQLFGAGLAVHVGNEIRQLGPRFQQLAERVDLARNGSR